MAKLENVTMLVTAGTNAHQEIFDKIIYLENGSIVSFAIISALLLPQSGDSWLVPLLIAATYLAVASILLRPKKFFLKDGGVSATN